MLNYEFTKQNPEISRLIEFGYDLHKRELSHHEYGVPNFEFYNGNTCPIKKIGDSGIFGKRGYPNHSQSYICTTLGICVGKKRKKEYILDYAYMLQTNNDDYSVYFSALKLKEDDKWYETLEYDNDNLLDKLTLEEQLKHFIKVMEYIGFKKEDVEDVIAGKLTAQEAYKRVAPKDIKDIVWVNKSRRIFEFENNVAISGNYSSMDLDTFPFPFEEQPIIDCSKVKIAYAYFETNKRKIKLININQSISPIEHTNLKNVIIEEPIDLSQIDFTGTKFGHHTVINLEYSIGQIETMDLSLAVNEEGKRYSLDEQGRLQYDEEFYPKTIPNLPPKDIKTLANVDNQTMALQAMENNADGIGLVRTEHMLTTIDDINMLIELLIDYPNKEEKTKILRRIKELQKQQLKTIISTFGNKTIIIRLLDCKIKEFIKLTGIQIEDDEQEDFEHIRGANVLDNNDDLLTAQLEAIFEELDNQDMDIKLLIPMIKHPNTFNRIKTKINRMSNNYNLKTIKIGAMIENEEIAQDADVLAKEADFIAIGTGDLTEDVTQIPRDITKKEYQELDSKVKTIIEETIFRARATNPNITIGICGEHANYVDNVAYYASLAIDYISCHPAFIKPNKDIINQIKSSQQPMQLKKTKKELE